MALPEQINSFLRSVNGGKPLFAQDKNLMGAKDCGQRLPNFRFSFQLLHPKGSNSRCIFHFQIPFRVSQQR
jgi:hypothetical protein